MAHTRWMYPIDLSGEDEARQALAKQPYFMLKCSKIIGATYVKEISKKDIPDIICDGYLYFIEEEKKYFVLHKQCAFLLGIFDLEMKRIFQKEHNMIKEKSKIRHEISNKMIKIEACLTYQNIVQSFLSKESEDYNKSQELLSNFKKQSNDLKDEMINFEKEYEKMIFEYLYKELGLLNIESDGINIQGTFRHYFDSL